MGQKKCYVPSSGPQLQQFKIFFCLCHPPFGVKNFVKIQVDRPIVVLDISIERIIYPQICVNRSSPPKKTFLRYGEVGEIFLVVNFFYRHPMMFRENFENLGRKAFRYTHRGIPFDSYF